MLLSNFIPETKSCILPSVIWEAQVHLRKIFHSWTWKTRRVDVLGMQTGANREKYVPEVQGKMTDHRLLQLTCMSLCLDYLHWLSLSWCSSRTFVTLEVPHLIKLLRLRWSMAGCMETSVLSWIMLSCLKAQDDEEHCSGYICVLEVWH